MSMTGSLLSQSGETPQTEAENHDFGRQPVLFVVGYSHLDSQWLWEYPKVIREYLPDTLQKNFDLFEKYPHYIFNFSGANRYLMIKEYYPAEYEKLKQYVAGGQWFPAGSSVEENDANGPSAESIFRQILYGNDFFRREFNKASVEYMLPDCFGFPWSLPSILAHAGLRGFSTQKLGWRSSAEAGGAGSPEDTPAGIPFNLGFWAGPDGRGVIAAFNPGDYNSDIRHDLTKADHSIDRDYVDWPRRLELNGKASGLYVDYHYYGRGDSGGAPRELSVKLLEAIVTKGRTSLPPPRIAGQPRQPGAMEGPEIQVGDGPVRVVSSTAEQLFLEITPEQAAHLPRYSGDLELIEHTPGTLSSQAYMKRWNRMNEVLADAAERASVLADWLGERSYPQLRLNRAWNLVLGGQFHDILAGTASPMAYEYSWNDEILAMNQFAGVVTSAAEGVARVLNTQTKGRAIVVFNPLNIAREDIVEANVSFPEGAPEFVRVVGPDGLEVPAQTGGANGQTVKVVFLARLPSIGFAVYDVQPADDAYPGSPMKITESSLENARYQIQINHEGDVACIFDKMLNRQLLSAPLRFAFQTHKPRDWPAWNMDWSDQRELPRSCVSGPATVRVMENGPARVSLEVKREAEGSRFVQAIRLSAGDAGSRVEFSNVIDWKTEAAALKAVLPLTATNPEATYNWDIGTIRRGNNDAKKYEVPSHQWFDLTDKSGAYGVTVLSDCKYGSDKPDDNTLRLTLLFSPGLGEGNARGFSFQASQDWGHHEFVFGLAGHEGDWRQERTDWQAFRLNQPLMAFEANQHAGVFGKSLSLLQLSDSRIRVLAVKKAEHSDEIVVRLVEMDGRGANSVRLSFAGPVTAAHEVNAQEMAPADGSGKMAVLDGMLVADFGPYQPRTFAVRLAPSPSRMAAHRTQPVTLAYDRSVASRDQMKSAEGFDAQGRCLPAEMLPGKISYGGIEFQLAPACEGIPNAVVAHGQTIALPDGRFKRLYLLAASADGDQTARFLIGNSPVDLRIQDWSGFIGQWDNRIWNIKQEPLPPNPGAPPGAAPATRTVLEYLGITPGFIQRTPVAWFASHRHLADGVNDPYAYSYLFAYSMEVPAGALTLTLPQNENIRILAATLSDESSEVRPAQPLYDVLERSADR